jgi:hypothetical protein
VLPVRSGSQSGGRSPRAVSIQTAAVPKESNAEKISRNIDIQPISIRLEPTILIIACRTHPSLEQAGHTTSKSRGFPFKNEHRRFSFVICVPFLRFGGPRVTSLGRGKYKISVLLTAKRLTRSTRPFFCEHRHVSRFTIRADDRVRWFRKDHQRDG